MTRLAPRRHAMLRLASFRQGAPRLGLVLLALAWGGLAAQESERTAAPPETRVAWPVFAPESAVALASFAPGANYDPALPTLDALLGFADFRRPASGSEIERACAAIAAASPRVRLESTGRSQEGRPLYALFVSAPETLDALAGLQADWEQLADRADEKSAKSLVDRLPAVVWVGASVHGNEPSGADAALALLYHLAADRSEATRTLLANALVIIDPLQNPDGRRRFLAEWENWRSAVPNLDWQSLQHRDGWPSARGNHYLLDLNRDWYAVSQSETRARLALLLRWQPQVVLDLHEMGSFDSYLFSPPREPYNPHLPEATAAWWRRFSQAQAAAFGARGWSCYTKDWHEEFNPNRGAAWSLFRGAVAILEEQASSNGAVIERPAGDRLGYGEAVQHHFVATLAVIAEAADERQALLADFARSRREGRQVRRGETRCYIIDAARQPERARRLVADLRLQGIRVGQSEAAWRKADARDYWNRARGDSPFPAGSYVIDLAQPEGRLARALLDFDPALGSEFLTQERRALETSGSSLLYEATAWCLPMAFAVDCYRSEKAPPPVQASDAASANPGRVLHAGASYGFLLDAGAAGTSRALAALLAAGYRVWGAQESFRAGGLDFGVGSLVLRRAENPVEMTAYLETLAAKTGAVFHGVDQALSEAGPDLGSRRFRPLKHPRVALLAGPPFYQTTFGALWFLLDRELGLPCALLRPGNLDQVDLDRYNVLLVPDASPGRGLSLPAVLGEAGMAALFAWVERGGTLIVLGEGNGLLFAGETPAAGLRAQRQVLETLGEYRLEALREREGRLAEVDEAALRAGQGMTLPGGERVAEADTLSLANTSLAEDEWRRRFSPRGAILRVDLDAGHWLCAGVGDRVPVLVKTDLALESKTPLQTPGRFAAAEELRLSGLLWPEARQRLAQSSYLSREKRGQGQIVSFLGNPFYRATFHGSGRLLINAILLGPGMGGGRTRGW